MLSAEQVQPGPASTGVSCYNIAPFPTIPEALQSALNVTVSPAGCCRRS